ncbi:MAG: SH3 domain-containing protein [Pseudomonadota bacterium]|nr:SH3 domain-containing protein [Pseudomonadota bacterium]
MLKTLILLILILLTPIISDDFISIKEVTNKANLRKGPGDWYPIIWQIYTPNLPVKVLEKGEFYNKVELHDGTQGWLSKILTSDKKNLIVTRDANLLSSNGKIKAKVLKDNIIKNYNCAYEKRPQLCKVEIQNIKGFIKKSYLWGF